MKIGPRIRWTLYGLAALATAAAMWKTDQGPMAAPNVDVVRPTRGPAATAPQVPVDARQARTVDDGDPLALRQSASSASSNDPFADEPQVATAPAATPMAAAPVVARPAAPALPYSYLGRWQENGKTVVYLQENGHDVVQVHGPGRLNDRYAVESVADDRMVLKYLPMGLRQTLVLTRTEGGGQPADTTQAGAPAASRADEEN